MKNLLKICGMTAGVVALGFMTSCSNADEPKIPGQDAPRESLLISAPKVTAWSGDQNFSSRSRATDVEQIGAVTASEIAAAKAYFSTKDDFRPASGGSDVEMAELASWTNYYIQDVVSGNPLPYDIAQFVGTNKEEVHSVAVWNMDPDEVVKVLNTPAYAENDAKVAVDLANGTLVTKHALRDITFETTGYSFGNVFFDGVQSSGHKGQYEWQPNYRIARLDGQDDAVYVALYSYTDSNNGFWNRIIKITRLDIADEPEVEEPEIVYDETIGAHGNEVEVNLSVLDTHDTYSIEDLMTKLSIHVRSAKDVKVRIPVSVEILVEADDLDIVMARPDIMIGENHKAQIEVNGHIVEVTVAFEQANDCAGNGFGYYIEVSTKGINKDVIAYCMNNYGDGLNFEIFNYYRWNVTDAEGNVSAAKPTREQIEALRDEWLNKTTVEFGYDNGTWHAYTNTGDYPYYFINALGDDTDKVMDCLVHVISNQSYAYENSFVGTHLNGSDHNIIYVRNDIFGTERQDMYHSENR